MLEGIKQIVDKSDKSGQFILLRSQKVELMKSLAGRISVFELS